MSITFDVEVTHADVDGHHEAFILVEGNDPLPDLPTILRHVALSELQGMTFREYRPGGTVGSTAPYSDMWVMAA